MLPVKWMPPEAFLDGIFTTKTDVWYVIAITIMDITTLLANSDLYIFFFSKLSKQSDFFSHKNYSRITNLFSFVYQSVF